MARITSRKGSPLFPTELRELINTTNLGSSDEDEIFQYPIYVHSFMHYGANAALFKYSTAFISFVESLLRTSTFQASPTSYDMILMQLHTYLLLC